MELFYYMKYHSCMKHIYTCILLLLLGCSSNPQTLYKIEKDGLFGYADSACNIIIEPTYSFAFTDTLNTIAFVTASENIIAINSKGKYLFMVFNYDNGPDYQSEGLFRIVNKEGEIGFADTLGNVIIKPQYKFAYPFKDGKAKVTNKGERKRDGEYGYWDSDEWSYIASPLTK